MNETKREGKSDDTLEIFGQNAELLNNLISIFQFLASACMHHMRILYTYHYIPCDAQLYKIITIEIILCFIF